MLNLVSVGREVKMSFFGYAIFFVHSCNPCNRHDCHDGILCCDGMLGMFFIIITSTIVIQICHCILQKSESMQPKDRTLAAATLAALVSGDVVFKKVRGQNALGGLIHQDGSPYCFST